MPKAVNIALFDLDDTLFPERDFVVSGFGAVARHLADRFGGSVETWCTRLLELLDRDGRGNVFDTLLEELGARTNATLWALVHIYRTHRPKLVLYDDVLPSFARLRAAGYRLGIVTDGKSCVQWNKIAALGLATEVDSVICTDDLGAAIQKPSPVPFQVALELHGGTVAQTAYVADDLSKDFIGPRQMGITTIRVDRGWEYPVQRHRNFPADHRADHVVCDLKEALQIIFQMRRWERI